MPKDRRYLLVISLMLIFSFIAVSAYSLSQLKLNSNPKVEVDKKEKYYLRSNATEYQKEIFEELLSADKEEDELKVLEAISKNYIADYFTWSNKLKINDVGGLQFLHPKVKAYVYQKSQDGFYQDMEYYRQNASSNSSLEVNEVRIESVEKKIFEEVNEEVIELLNFNPQDRNSYSVIVSWDYLESNFNLDEFSNTAQLTLIQDDNGDWSILEVLEYES